jgi:CYTH domain-containing protein
VTLPRYAKREVERRFLVAPDAPWRALAAPYARRISDRYLACGLLRLRRLVDLDTGRTVLKLTKKYPGPGVSDHPIVTILLEEPEYAALAALPAHPLEKVRHWIEHEGRTFGVDVFEGPLAGLITAETEARDPAELSSVQPPPWTCLEVTDDPFFTGGGLARATADAVRARLG